MGESPWTRISASVNQDWEVRRPLIKRIGVHYKAKVITFFTSFWDEHALIRDSDAELLESLLSDEHDGGRLLLILNSPGGIALAAERIVNVCRSYSNEFEVLVPHMAKSAATLICFGASKIHMSDTSELGPVDPQVYYLDAHEKRQWISAAEYIRSYEKLMKEAISGAAERIEPLMQQLERYDARHIEQLKSAQKLSEELSVSILASGMLSGVQEEDIRTRIRAFLAQEETRTHGRMIGRQRAEDCGLNVEPLDLGSKQWRWIWELYLSSDWVVTHRACKLVETDCASLAWHLE